MGGELRYNLIDASGNSDAIIRGISSGTNVHHNIVSFTVSQTFYEPGTGLDLLYNVDNVQFYNNVMDGGGAFMKFYGNPVSVTAGSFSPPSGYRIGSIMRMNRSPRSASPASGRARSSACTSKTDFQRA